MDELGFVQRCTKGDTQAWDEFVEKYSRLLYSHIYALLSSYGYASAQDSTRDIFQEFFCFLIKDDYKKLKSFAARNGCSLASWLRQVVINFTIDYLRRLKPAVSLDAHDEEESSLMDVLAAESAHTLDELSLQERRQKLTECIEKLAEDDKFFVELHIHEGFTLEELRVMLKRSRGAVDMQKSRIIARLRECFKSKGFALDF